ncbi:MAG: ABC transporter ATP-binding protein, partial [Pseudomonadota bacterium]|nr:ABC transporter ATP-binding protein [Pseudomonadota bacterium]
MTGKTAAARPAPAHGEAPVVGRLVRDYVARRWPAIAAAAACMIVASAMSGAMAYVSDPATKMIFLQTDPRMLAVIPLVLLVIIALRAVSSFGQDVFLNSVAERVVADVQRDMFKSQIRLDIGAVNASHSGELISGFLYDTTLLRNSITRGAAGLGYQLVTFVAYVVVMFYEDWQLSLISVALLPLVAWVTGALSRSLRKASTRSMEESGVLSKALSEALSGRRIIKAYNLESHAAKLADGLISQRLLYLLRAVRARAAAVPATDLIGGFAAAVTFAYAGYQHFHGQLEINQFMAFLASMLLAQQPIRTLSQLWAIASEGMAAARRIFAIIDAKPSVADRPGARPLRIAPGSGRVTFQNVSFAYGGEAGVPALTNIDLDVSPGSKIALVGPSGAGKSTVFSLLLRF